jgi:hypothetical protein
MTTEPQSPAEALAPEARHLDARRLLHWLTRCEALLREETKRRVWAEAQLRETARLLDRLTSAVEACGAGRSGPAGGGAE